MKNRKSSDTGEVIRQERARGQRYVYSEEEKATYQIRKKLCKDLLRTMTFEEIATALSLQRGKPEYDEYYQIWRNYRRDRDESY